MRTCLLRAFICLVSLVAYVRGTSATPESHASALFLLASPSTRVNGMGQAGVALWDEPGGYYNPAVPALVARRHFFGTTNYLGKMKWLGSLADDLRYSYNTFQVGWGMDLRSLGSRWDAEVPDGYMPFSFSAALGYYRSEMDFGEQYRTDELGSVVGTFRDIDVVNAFVFSMGVGFLLDFGAGIAVKHIASELGDYKATPEARDMGVHARLPVVETVEFFRGRKTMLFDGLRPMLDVGIGVSWNNRGDEFIYKKRLNPLPGNRKIGVALSAGLSRRGRAYPLDLVRITCTYEKYTPQISGFENDDEASDDKIGLELSLYEIWEPRFGLYNDYDGEVRLITMGSTLKSDGIVKWVVSRRSLKQRGTRKGGWLYFMTEHVSVSWSWFRYKDRGEDSPLGGTGHSQLTVLFR